VLPVPLQSKAVLNLCGDMRVLCTGTPFNTGLVDMHNQVRLGRLVREVRLVGWLVRLG
jgi:hypothetical protein